MSTLELAGVSKTYGTVRAVDAVDLCLGAGSLMAVVGPSGSGKTTLLRLIAGFEAPDAGTVRLGGETLADGATGVAPHLRNIGYVPQEGALFPHLSAADNIAFGLRTDRRTRARRVDELLEMVELDRNLRERRPHELSGGQQQRVALARALAQQPRLMLLDEPFSALDAGLRATTRRAVARMLRSVGMTSILVTHDQAEALTFGDRLAVMRAGRVVQSGTPIDLYRRPLDEATALFLGDGTVLDATMSDGRADCALGRLAVDDDTKTGDVRILLRPWQLAVAADDGARAPGRGIVTAREFNGESVLVRVTIAEGVDGRPLPSPLVVDVPAAVGAEPSIGTTVHVDTRGLAHVLAPPR